MIAFWKYDSFPYCLGGRVDKIRDDKVYIKDYMGWFTPTCILPDITGERVLQNLEDLRADYTRARAELETEYCEMAKSIASFL